ncbi:MAG TPA: methyltransferase domain-containing protein [Streptosporangiaceae bacterium]|nr:methyltransferase domain-containing protein [Streptosporangiaceae bacterium]
MAVVERVLRLLRQVPEVPDLGGGYLNLLGPADEPAPTVAQRAMQSAFLPQIYEKLWRPIGFNVAKGWPFGPDTARENDLTRRRLGLGRPGDLAKPAAMVLDVACGPGNVTRALAAGTGEDGLVVGIDASVSMLRRAVEDTHDKHVGYVRGNALDLPFRDGVFDAVSCFGALYLFDDPWAAVDSMTRVLKPGGHLVILTTRAPRLPLAGQALTSASQLTGIRLFGHDEVAAALRARGFEGIRLRPYPLMQFVSARVAAAR